MDREKQFATELRALHTLCDEAIPRNLRQNLIQSLGSHAFREPEHQVIFESVCAIFQRGPISVEQLRIHLNNRGFPDTDVDEYFQSGTTENLPPKGTSTR